MGRKVQGMVTKIKTVAYTKWGNQSPNIIYFSYKDNGNEYKGKSHLIWDTLTIYEGDIVNVYVDEYKKHHFFIDI